MRKSQCLEGRCTMIRGKATRQSAQRPSCSKLRRNFELDLTDWCGAGGRPTGRARMLSEREKHGVAELLTKMSLADLASLCQTVTSRQAPRIVLSCPHHTLLSLLYTHSTTIIYKKWHVPWFSLSFLYYVLSTDLASPDHDMT